MANQFSRKDKGRNASGFRFLRARRFLMKMPVRGPVKVEFAFPAMPDVPCLLSRAVRAVPDVPEPQKWAFRDVGHGKGAWDAAGSVQGRAKKAAELSYAENYDLGHAEDFGDVFFDELPGPNAEFLFPIAEVLIFEGFSPPNTEKLSLCVLYMHSHACPCFLACTTPACGPPARPPRPPGPSRVSRPPRPPPGLGKGARWASGELRMRRACVRRTREGPMGSSRPPASIGRVSDPLHKN